jgi:hypothetical protein
MQAIILFISYRPNFGPQDDSGLLCLVHPGARRSRRSAILAMVARIHHGPHRLWQTR